jgi:predicted unusual protein kinase regulating ubiquinone biosynthesis (AarF/ABC1/UbiB family)
MPPDRDDARGARLREALRRAADLLAGTSTTRAVLQGLAEVVDPAVLPGELRDDVVERLEAAGPPAPLGVKDVERRLRSAWGGSVARTLDELDPEPVAVTPAAQVHRAVADGAEVAVKLRRPGLAEAVRNDLAVLDAVAPLFTPFVPRADPGAVVREVRERALDELDLEHEAATQRAFHRALRRHDALLVPAPRTDLARDDVLVSAWVEGIPVGELAERGSAAQRRRAAELLVRFALGALRHGTAHAGLGPGDALLLDGAEEGARLAILDFGAVGRVAPGRAGHGADLLDAVAAGDARAAGDALAALGWLPADDAARAVALTRHAAGPLLAGSARLDAAALRAAAERGLDRLGPALDVLRGAAAPAADLWPLRGVGALVLLLARLDVEADWVALAGDALREGW